jgi:signal transduction histidine kinase/DNA-binding response OmpR family regulator
MSASKTSTSASASSIGFLAGGGEMGERIRSQDWSKTSLGPIDAWSPALKTMTSILLANRFPMLLWWGPDSISIYNDAYIPVLGAKHGGALGQPVKECWAEIYDVLRPLILTPLNGGPPTWSEDLLLEIRRHGFLEETHWTVAYSPVPDDTVANGIGGVLATVHEITAQVVSTRRNALLRDLGASVSTAKSAESVCRAAAAAIARDLEDAPFALFYLRDDDRTTAHLVAAAGAEPGSGIAPRSIDLEGDDDGATWPLGEVLRSQRARRVPNLAARFGRVPRGPWLDPPAEALVLPIDSGAGASPTGAVVLGLSPRLAFDVSYQVFLDLASSQLSTAMASAGAYAVERRRAESLAELDRAKTAFFANVSHEFRTPLTLMLGHVADSLEDEDDPLSAGQRHRQEAVERNALRLLKLVNSLLEFSRIEAGRAQASYEATDVAALTTETASTFRSLVERAGLRLTLDCPPAGEQVFVDRLMWEKIVLNLLSNAYKFTRSGEILVRLTSSADAVSLVVRDTGVGIGARHLPHLFERFYRVEGSEGRTQEGTGIGLALVRELARLHGGTAAVESEEGVGTTVTVRVPRGCAHLPGDRLARSGVAVSPSISARPFLEEAGGWPAERAPESSRDAADVDAHRSGSAIPHLLVADDNADMRAYLVRLLRPLGTVEAVTNGLEAMAAIGRRLPDLVLSDVMMPGLDGVALVRALRGDPRTRTLPVMLVSARAGEESRVDGASTGADDYVVKPFSSRELVARVRAQLDLARLRREYAESMRSDLDAMTWLQRLGSVFLREGELQPVWDTVVEAAVAISGADAGTMQTLDDEGAGLTVVARKGLPAFACGHVVHSTPLVGRSGKPLGVISTHYGQAGGPSERSLRLLELLARQAADILERAQMVASLRCANARLAEADRHKTEFLAMLSHELRNPLTPIVTGLELIDRAPSGDPRAARAMRVIDRQVEQLSRLVNDLLDVTRISENKLQLHLEHLELGEIVRCAVDDSRAFFERAGVHVELAVEESPVFVVVDRTRMRQIVANILHNAAKFAPTGGLARVTVGVEGEQAVVRVTDDGIGMSPEDLERLFQPFAQAEQGLDRSRGGLGLGLALVKRLVEMHGGSVSARSDGVGRGAELTVRVPTAAEPVLVERDSHATPPTTPRRVLVIEDNVDAAEVLRDVLGYDGHEVAVAHNGVDGLAEARRFHPDVVLCDIGLPGMDGYDVARAFRADEALKGTFLVALTGYALSEDLRRAMDAGFEQHLAKPPGLDELAQVMAEAGRDAGLVARGA